MQTFKFWKENRKDAQFILKSDQLSLEKKRKISYLEIFDKAQNTSFYGVAIRHKGESKKDFIVRISKLINENISKNKN